MPERNAFRRQSNTTFRVSADGHGRAGLGELGRDEAHVLVDGSDDEPGGSSGSSEVGEAIVSDEKRFARARRGGDIGAFGQKERVFVTKLGTENACGFRIFLVTRTHRSPSIGAWKVAERNPHEHEGRGMIGQIHDILHHA